MAIRMAGIDLRATTDRIDMEPFGVLLERADGLGIEYRFLPEVVDGRAGVRGYGQYLQRMRSKDGLADLNSVWLNCGALMEFARTDSIAPVFDERRGQITWPLLTPREWLVRESIWNLPGGSWVGLVVVDDDATIEELYETYVVEGLRSGTFPPRDEIPSTPWGNRYGEGFTQLEGEDQVLETLRMMMRGICGHLESLESPVATEIRVVASPESRIREAWAELDAWREVQREYLYEGDPGEQSTEQGRGVKCLDPASPATPNFGEL